MRRGLIRPMAYRVDLMDRRTTCARAHCELPLVAAKKHTEGLPRGQRPHTWASRQPIYLHVAGTACDCRTQGSAWNYWSFHVKPGSAFLLRTPGFQPAPFVGTIPAPNEHPEERKLCAIGDN